MADYNKNKKLAAEIQNRSSDSMSYKPNSEIEARYHEFYLMMHVWLCEDFMHALEVLNDSKASEKEIRNAEMTVDRCLDCFFTDHFEFFCDRLHRNVGEVIEALIKLSADPFRRRLPGMHLLEKDEFFHA